MNMARRKAAESLSYPLRVNGVIDPATFESRLTTPPKAFNSETGYAGKLILRISQVSQCQ